MAFDNLPFEDRVRQDDAMSSTEAPRPGHDRKQLSPFDATMLVMGGIIGVGIFFAPQTAARLIPETLPFLLLWIGGGVIAMCGALTFAEWGGSLPKAGGWFVFLAAAFGPFLAFLFAWVILGVVSTGALAVIAAFGASQIAELGIGIGPSGTTSHLLVAAAFILSLTAIVLGGIKLGATVQNVCMLTKLIAILALAVGGLAFFAPGSAPAPMLPPADPAPTNLLGNLPAALLAVFFSYGGWQHLCYVAPALRDPRRTLPRAIVLGVALVIVTYVLVNVAYVRVLGMDGLASTPNFAAECARRTFGPRAATALAGVMAVSAFGVCAVNIIVSPAIYVAMARDGLFFRSFARLHPRTGAPVLALLLQCVITLLYLLWAHASAGNPKPPPDSHSFHMDIDALITSVVFAEWFFHAAIAWGLLRIRKTRPDLPRPFKSPLWPLAPVLYLATAALVLIGNVWSSQPSVTLLGLGVLALGGVVYQAWKRF